MARQQLPYECEREGLTALLTTMSKAAVIDVIHQFYSVHWAPDDVIEQAIYRAEMNDAQREVNRRDEEWEAMASVPFGDASWTKREDAWRALERAWRKRSDLFDRGPRKLPPTQWKKQ